VNDVARKIALVLVSVVVTLVVAEIALRLVGYGALTPEMSFGVNTRTALEQGQFQSDPDLFWKLPARPSQADQAMKAVHPDQPVPARKAPRRILVLGDSCSRLSMRTLPYSAQLEDLLWSDGFEVLNASVPGYTTYQGLVWLRTQLLDLKPDIVVVYFGWNDHWRATGMTDHEYAASRGAGRLRLLELGRRRPEEPPVRVPLAEYEANLEAIVTEIQAIGAQVVLVAAPHRLTVEATRRLAQTGYILPGENPTSLHNQYLKVVRSFAEREGVAVLSADHLMTVMESDQPLLMRDGIHLTDEAHAIMAAALAALVRDGTGANGRVSEELVEAVKKGVNGG